MDQIEEVRVKNDIVALISGYLPLKKAGRNFRGLCPFHNEKTPSFMVSAERQMFKCFGCGEGGDVFKFLMKKENLEFGEALRLLAEKAGIELKDYQPTGEQKAKEKLLEINHLAAEFYHYLLTEHALGKKARQYLQNRGINKDSIRLFKLGYSPDSWDSLQQYLVAKKKYENMDLEAAELIIKNDRGGFYDRFRGRVMFPLMDVRGRVMGFSGRALEEKPASAEASARQAKYINSPETRLYHKSELLYGLEITKEEVKKANRAIIVEGELDMISSYQAGVKNVAAIKGSALTVEQIALLKRFCENLSLALDSDVAGDAASRRGIGLAETAGLSVRVIQVIYGKDPDECAQKEAKLWKDSVKAAVPVYDFYLQSAVKRFGTATIEGKKKIMAEMAGVLNPVTNQVIKAHYLKKVAEALGVGEEAVAAEVDKAIISLKPAVEIKIDIGLPKSREERIDEYLLALILQSDEAVKTLAETIDPDIFAASAVKKIFLALVAWFKANKNWAINDFIKVLPEELVRQADSAYLLDLGLLTNDSEALAVEVDRTIEARNKLSLKNKLQELSEQIKAAEQNKDKEKVGRLQKAFQEIASGLI